MNMIIKLKAKGPTILKKSSSGKYIIWTHSDVLDLFQDTHLYEIRCVGLDKKIDTRNITCVAQCICENLSARWSCHEVGSWP